MFKDISVLIGVFSGVFIASAAVSYFVMAGARKLRGQGQEQIVPTGPVILRSPTGIYRSHFVSGDLETWTLSAPLQRNAYVPLTVGESLKIEAPVRGGAVLFATTVLARNAETHEFTLSRPRLLRISDRRAERRTMTGDAAVCELNGQHGKLINLSTTGALVLSSAKPENGDLIRLVVDGQEVVGYALESVHESIGDRLGGLTRIQFQSPISLR